MRHALLAMVLCFLSTAAYTRQIVVPQNPEKLEQLQAKLDRVHLPPGFRIDVFAIVPDARQMAVGRAAVFVGTTGTRVYVVNEYSGLRNADTVRVFAPSIRMKIPNGVCLGGDGTLYVAEQNRVLQFPGAETTSERAGPNVVTDRLIPQEEESYNHSARICRIGPDDKLYVALGEPYNVPPKSKMDSYNRWGIGGIIRMDRDGRNREVVAYGIRNSVGMDFQPKTGQLWFTDNQVDGMGDDVPPGELNHLTKPGQNFGFPWYGGGHTRTPEYRDERPPAGLVFPDVETVAHAADLGMTFYRGGTFPEKYKGAIFSAQHGSWNRTVPVGARVMVTFFKADGTIDHAEPFAEGWLDENTGRYSGRPVDVAELADGSLLISDDYAGAIYRVSYKGS